MILHGKDIVILNSSGTALIGAAKSCEVDVDVDTEEVSSPDTGAWKVYKTMRKGWSTTISHLVTELKGTILSVGDTVTLRLTVARGAGLPFDGMADNVTLQTSGYAGRPDAVYWDTTRKIFVGRVGTISPKYYSTWSIDDGYCNPLNGARYYNSATSYVWYSDNTLTPDVLTGTAIVRQGRITGSVGSLAQGSVRLLGTGPLAEPTT